VRTVALATCKELPHLDGDEVHLVAALRARGIEPHAIAWDDDDAKFLAHDLVVIRSTWDYTERVDEFVSWAQRIELALKGKGARCSLENGASVVRWNTHKRYLVELEAAGVAIVPTIFVPRATSLADALHGADRERKWLDVVVKPAVSAGSRDTYRVDLEELREADGVVRAFSIDAAQKNFAANRDLLVQRFVDGIGDGEISLIYIDGEFSHAVNKKPKLADFRSQPEFGSLVAAADATSEQRHAAEHVLRTVGGNLLYARVDFVRGDDGRPWLMELELVEPSLYLAYDDKAAAKLASAIERKLNAVSAR
jgi:hypothetical protein